MRIMYPSNDPNEDTLKVLRAALVAIGMVKSDPDAADKILELGAKADPAGVVDPSQIRDIFSAWCRRTIPVTVISEDGSPTTGGGSHGVQPSKDTGAKSIDLSEITVRFTKGSMCSTKSQSSKTLISSSGRAQGTEPSRLRAVTSPKVLQKRWPLDQIAVKPDNKDYRVPATYSIAPCPISKAKGVETIDPTDYRVKLVKDALEEWAKYASIDFIQMAHPSESDAKLDDPRHLAIVFQDYHYSTGNHFTLNGDDYRSYTNFKTQVITPPPENIYTPEEFKSEMELHEASPPIKHTICIRGVIDNEEEGSKPAPNIAQVLAGIIVTNEMVAVRTITHEVSSRIKKISKASVTNFVACRLAIGWDLNMRSVYSLPELMKGDIADED